MSFLTKDILSFIFPVMLTLEEFWTQNKKSPTPVLTEFGDNGNSSPDARDSRIRSLLDHKGTDELCFASASSLDLETERSTPREELLVDM